MSFGGKRMTTSNEHEPKANSWSPQWVSGMSLRNRLLVVAVIELAYWIATRITLRIFNWDSLEAEFLRLALRSTTALACFWLLRDLIFSRVARQGEITRFPTVVSATLFVGAAFAMPHPKLSPAFAILFGIGSIAVALKEEFLFRGVIQNLLQRRFGFAKSVLLTTIVFTAWHYGAVPNTRWQFVQVFMASVFVGVIYVRTGNIWAAVGLHTAYDAVIALPTLVTYKYSVGIAFLMLLGAVYFSCLPAFPADDSSLTGSNAKVS